MPRPKSLTLSSFLLSIGGHLLLFVLIRIALRAVGLQAESMGLMGFAQSKDFLPETVDVSLSRSHSNGQAHPKVSRPVRPPSKNLGPSNGSDQSIDSGSSTSTGNSISGAGNSPGLGNGESYYSRLRAKIQDHTRYPPHLSRRRVEGRVELELVLEPSGQLRSSRVATQSGSAELDETALSAARAAAPFEPYAVEHGPQTLRLPMDFRTR